MVNNFKRYLLLFKIFSRINLLKAMEYRFDFIFVLVPTMTYSIGYLLFMGTVLSKVPTISGWNFDRMLILFIVDQIFFYLSWAFFRGSLETFPESIKSGNFDLQLRMPVNTRFLVSFKEQSPDTLVPFLITLGVFVYVVRNFTLDSYNYFLFVFFIICGMFILYNLMFLMASLAFWTTESNELIELVDLSNSLGRYPLEIFPKLIGILLMTLVPVVLMVYVPATALIGILNWRLGLLSILVATFSWTISQKVWKTGMKYYSSASS